MYSQIIPPKFLADVLDPLAGDFKTQMQFSSCCKVTAGAFTIEYEGLK